MRRKLREAPQDYSGLSDNELYALWSAAQEEYARSQKRLYAVKDEAMRRWEQSMKTKGETDG